MGQIDFEVRQFQGFEDVLTVAPTENPIQPSDACTYKNYPLILPIGIRNSVFLVLLPLYGSLPFSPSPCTLLFCASKRMRCAIVRIDESRVEVELIDLVKFRTEALGWHFRYPQYVTSRSARPPARNLPLIVRWFGGSVRSRTDNKSDGAYFPASGRPEPTLQYPSSTRRQAMDVYEAVALRPRERRRWLLRNRNSQYL